MDPLRRRIQRRHSVRSSRGAGAGRGYPAEHEVFQPGALHCRRSPAQRLFFYLRPPSAFPLLDRLVVALDRAPFGFLMTPLQTMPQPPNVIGVVVDPELLVDEQGDARRGPQVRVVAASHRPSQQQLDQALQPFRPQLRRSPRGEANAQCLLSAAHGTSA